VCDYVRCSCVVRVLSDGRARFEFNIPSVNGTSRIDHDTHCTCQSMSHQHCSSVNKAKHVSCLTLLEPLNTPSTQFVPVHSTVSSSSRPINSLSTSTCLPTAANEIMRTGNIVRRASVCVCVCVFEKINI
jgi:hypothetical protein